MTARICLQGYYGHGNFGDDVLMIVAHDIVRRIWPGAEIAVRVEHPDGMAYIPRLLPGVALVRPGDRSRYDVIVQGGGGVYFDWSRGGLGSRALEAAIRTVGWRAWVAGERLLRRIAGRQRPAAALRIGLGLGVGTFARGSGKLRRAMPLIRETDAIWVRDQESVANWARLNPRVEPVLGSDLAFLTDAWRPRLRPRGRSGRRRLGVILRPDAQRGAPMAETAPAAVAALAERHAVTVFGFHAGHDGPVLRALEGHPQIVWNPREMALSAFAEALAGQDALLTARAHGAICGACLGVPSAVLGIEPKLETVQRMLPGAAVPADPTRPESWGEAVERALGIGPEPIMADVDRNRRLGEAALGAVMAAAGIQRLEF